MCCWVWKPGHGYMEAWSVLHSGLCSSRSPQSPCMVRVLSRWWSNGGMTGSLPQRHWTFRSSLYIALPCRRPFQHSLCSPELLFGTHGAQLPFWCLHWHSAHLLHWHSAHILPFTTTIIFSIPELCKVFFVSWRNKACSTHFKFLIKVCLIKKTTWGSERWLGS